MSSSAARNTFLPTPAPSGAVLLSPESWYLHIPQWLVQRHGMLEAAAAQLDWERPDVTMFGKTVRQPRDTAVCGISMDPASKYCRYNPPKVWTYHGALVRDMVNDWAKATGIGWQANGMIANYYADGCDSIGLHADDEPALGIDPIVVSVSLGAARDLRITSHKNTRTIATVRLGDGDLFVMAGRFQQTYRHAIDKIRGPVGPRLSLTFRWYA